MPDCQNPNIATCTPHPTALLAQRQESSRQKSTTLRWEGVVVGPGWGGVWVEGLGYVVLVGLGPMNPSLLHLRWVSDSPFRRNDLEAIYLEPLAKSPNHFTR